jgi:uncharacterized membrane protein YkvA (DUF1232 family)
LATTGALGGGEAPVTLFPPPLRAYGDTGAVDDFVRGVLIGLAALVVVGLAVVGWLMWRFRIPPRGVVAMVGALFYLALPVDLVPEALLGPIGVIDDTGVLAAVGIWVYKLVKARQKLVEGGVIKRPPPTGG